MCLLSFVTVGRCIKMYFAIFLLLCCVFAVCSSSYEERSCWNDDGTRGKCVTIDHCERAMAHISRDGLVEVCPHRNGTPLVCCVPRSRQRRQSRWPNSQDRWPRLQGYGQNGRYQLLERYKIPADPDSIVFPSYDDAPVENVKPVSTIQISNNAGVDKENEKCPPIPDYAIGNNTKTGTKALDKCVEFVKLVFPCNAAAFTDTGYIRDNDCAEDRVHISVVGGTEAQPNKYPHMVVLGFGENESEVSWQCGGTLISEYFVMTAGHCIFNRDFGRLSFARFGAHKLSDKPPPDMIYKIAEIIKHSQYRAPSKYHDIALLRMDRRVKFSRIVRPACLNVEEEVPLDLKATGWGVTETGGELSDVLMDVDLKSSSAEECKQIHQPTRTLKSGIDSSFQICAGDPKKRKDTCQGDSGGPLQFHSKDLYCTYNIVGITSFGKSCGTPGVPGVYTRVSYYVPWIESVVWP